MQPTSITIERTFYLGAAGPKQFPESVQIAISWSLEAETIEEAEEKAIVKLYEMAERERKRRYAYIKAAAKQREAEEKTKSDPKTAEAAG